MPYEDVLLSCGSLINTVALCIELAQRYKKESRISAWFEFVVENIYNHFKDFER